MSGRVPVVAEETSEERFELALDDRNFYRRAIAKYGYHLAGCPATRWQAGVRGFCDCGWEEFKGAHLHGV